uniref:Putative ribonuclease H-like domain-containing protein n=1 Tax=Tanacetum cinerariifolium TaxID=118510 RepID=A0A6L2J9Y2_TANCI|nr:putative ribonuclease H-like domain-containing protein [Tanacetum cinerariifolium]
MSSNRFAVRNKLSEDQMVKTVFVCSDMEFDLASLRPWKTDYEQFKESLTVAVIVSLVVSLDLSRLATTLNRLERSIQIGIYKRFQSLSSQLEIHGVGVSTEDANQKFLRYLPTSWSQVSLIMRTKPGVDTLSFDDLYNNLRVFESDVKGFTASSSSTQNVVFVSSKSTSSTSEASTAFGVSTSSGHNSQREGSSSYTDELMYSFFANQSSDPELDHEDLEQLDEFDLEEIDLKWQVTMIYMRLKKFCKKIGKKLQFDAKKPVGFDKTKVECFNPKDNGRRPGKQEEHKALVTLDGDGVDCTGHSEDEQENFAFMAYNNSGSDTKREQLGDASIEIQAYDQALKKVEAQLVAHQKNQHWSSNIEDSLVNDRYAERLHVVSPSMTGIYMPPRPDFRIDESMFTYGPKQSKTSKSDAETSNSASCESNSSVETLESVPKPVANEPKAVSEPKVWSDAPIIKEYESDSDDEHVTIPSKEQEKPSFAFVNTVKHVKTPRQTVKEQNTCSQNPKPNKRDWNGLMSKKLGLGYGFTKKACFVCGIFSHLIKNCDFHEKRMAKQVELNNQKDKSTGPRENRPVWNNVRRLNHQNKFVPTTVLTKTSRFPINAARQNFSSQTASTSTARKVNTTKPIVNEIRPRNNFYKSHSPIKRPFNRTTTPKYNFSYHKVNTAGDKTVSAVGGNRETAVKALADYTECLVLSPDFKLPDENQVLLRVPRQNNMYSFNLENIVPTGGLAFLIAKATVDESNKWHRRLGHVNFKNLNKLVKENLVRGIKREYSNARTQQQNGVAKRKNRTLIEAARTMLAYSFLLNTFWAEAVSTTCYVLNRVLVIKPQNKAPYELITGKIPIISYIIPFGCHVTIVNTIDHLGKFDGKSDEGFLVGYSLNSKAFKPVRSKNQASKTAGPKVANHSAAKNGSKKPKKDIGLKSNEKPVDQEEQAFLEELERLKRQKRKLMMKLKLLERSLLKDIYDHPSFRIFSNAFYDDEGTVADFTNLETTVNVSPIPTSRIHSIHPTTQILGDLTLAVQTRSKMDVKSAFLYGKINEEVYVTQPLGFVDPKYPKKVYKVVKSLYGLHQAPRAWYATLSIFLLKNGYRRRIIDKTLFIKKDKKDIMLLKQKEDGIFISQDKYVAEILKKFDFMSVKTASNPIETQKPLTKDEEAADVDVYLYRSIIGSLMYLTASRFLKGKPKPKLGLWYPRVSSFDLEAYSDNDYAGANLDRKSTTRGCQFLVFHSKTKHIAIRYQFIRDAYEKKLIQVLKIHTDDNVFDLLTKAFDVSRNFVLLVQKFILLGLVCATQRCFTIVILLRLGKKMQFGLVLGALNEKTKGNSEFHEIVDFLTSNMIHHALTQIHATVDSKAVVVTEASIRSSLLINDDDGTACLTNEAIFQNLALMGYEGELNKLTFQKALFSSQWKYLIYTILYCLSSKSTSWNEFSTNIASAVICLATNQKFNFSKLIFDGMLRNLDNPKKKFLIYPRFLMVFLNTQIELGEPFNDVYTAPAHNLKVFSNMSRKGLKFSGKITPLFPNMLIQAESEGSGAPTEPQPTPSPTNPGIGDQPFVNESSSSHNTTQDSRDSLEGTNRSEGDQRLSMKKRFGKKESVSKQRRKKDKPKPTLDDSTFDGLDADHGMDYIDIKEPVNEGRLSEENDELKLTIDTKEITQDKGSGEKGGSTEKLVSTARPEDSTVRLDVGTVDLIASLKTTTSIFNDEDITMAQTLIKMKEEKAKEKGVSIKDIEDSLRPTRSILTLNPLPTIDPKDKGKGVLEEPEPTKKMPKSDLDAAQIAKDAKVARLVYEEELAELEREKEKRHKEEEASKAAIAEMYDEGQAGIEADALFAAKLQ